MEWARGVETLPVWKEVCAPPDAAALGKADAATAGDADAAAAGKASLSDLVSVQPLAAGPAAEGDRLAAYVLSDQQSADDGSQVTLRVCALPPQCATGGAGAGSEVWTLNIEVPGYDVDKSGPFRELLVGAGGRGALLLAPGCCAAVAIPELGNFRAEAQAVPLVPPSSGVTFVKVLWHPLSDAHAGALLSDGTFQLLNLAHRAAITEPEVSFEVTFGGGCETGESVADFTFCAAPSGPTAAGESVWLSLAVLFLSTAGRLSFRSPVLPTVAVLPRAALNALSATAESDGRGGALEAGVGAASVEVREWLGATLLCPANRHEVPLRGGPGGLVSIRHQLHLHGNTEVYYRRWRPSEQVPTEERAEGSDSSPRSPRHQRSSYCSVHLVSHSPVAIVARATVTGLLEILILSGALGPAFERGGKGRGAGPLCFAVFDEIDLVLSPTKAPTLRLSAAPSPPGGGPVLLARTRTLVAAVELDWAAVLQKGDGAPVDSLPTASVSTLVEVKAGDGPGEIVGWQLVQPTRKPQETAPAPCAGLWLRTRGGKAEARALDVSVLAAAGKRAAKNAPEKAALKDEGPAPPDREEYLKRLVVPMVLPSPLFGPALAEGAGLSAAAVAKAVAKVQGGHVADLAARQSVLAHLTAALPARASSVRTEVAELQKSGQALKEAAGESEKSMKRVGERQKDLEAKHERLVTALRGELEFRELDGFAADQLPKLWSQLHDLRQAFELLRAAAAPDGPADASGRSAWQLATVESLQRTWTDSASEQLRHQAEQVEAAVAAAKAAVEQRRGS